MTTVPLPLPPFEYRSLVCGSGGEGAFEKVGCILRDLLEAHGMLGSNTDFLDVGCGCGRLALFLRESPIRSYVGFDRHPGMINWCQTVISAVDPRFRFQHVDATSVYATWDGHAGSLPADRLDFPFPDDAFDSVILSSVFTHMDLRDIRRYLEELARVLRPEGRILASVCLSEGEPYREDELNFFHDAHAFVALAADAGLVPRPVNKLGYKSTQNWYLLTRARGRRATARFVVP